MIRLLYRLVLRLHPRLFRQRFAQEMLWIFDEAHHPASYLVDALLSLLRQHARGEAPPQPALEGFGLLETGPGITPRRLAEASVGATLLLAVMLLLLAHPPRLAVLPVCPPGATQSGAPLIHAPSRIQPLIASVAPSDAPTGPAQIDHALGGALQVLHAQPNSTGFCAAP